jgi:hypothetical protein
MKHFIRHYVEMVVVMFVGMAVLYAPLDLAFELEATAAMIGAMGVTMTAPMVPWMRWRGHAWAPTLEMAAAMVVPTVASLGVLAADIVTSSGALMGIEHTAMFAGMFLVMLARNEEYAHHGHQHEVAA